MATVVSIRFPWGRYHATPWGRNVNEAAIEWPPSPWRLVRALYATWMARAPYLDADLVHGLLDRLCDPPRYRVPIFALSQTRHYLPDISHMGGMPQRGPTTEHSADARDKALDAFAVVPRDDLLLISWDADLDGAHRAVLGELCRLVPYLGRAESLCEMSLETTVEADARGTWVEPVAEDPEAGSPPSSIVRLLTPSRPLDLQSVTTTTSALSRLRRRQPPGTDWVPYTAAEAAVPTFATESPRFLRPAAVRWTIHAPAPPSRFATLAMTDVLRQAAIKWRMTDRAALDGHSETLLGKTRDGAKLESQHQHAHYLALPAGDSRSRLLGTLLLWAPMGLDEPDFTAAMSIKALRGREFLRDFRPCRLGLEGWGTIEEVAPELTRPSRVWRTFTPFVPARHRGRRSWEEHVIREVRQELAWRALDGALLQIEPIPGDWLSYRTHRIDEGLHAARRGAGVRITFSERVAGPIVLGALSHFGLGLFLPEEAAG